MFSNSQFNSTSSKHFKFNLDSPMSQVFLALQQLNSTPDQIQETSYFSELTQSETQSEERPITLDTYIINTIKTEKSMSILEKIIFVSTLNSIPYQLSKCENIYEEECHLSLLNWIWERKSFLKTMENICPAQWEELTMLIELFFYILNIIELFPLKSVDILDLKMFEKLNKLKGYFKWNIPLLNKINSVLSQWKSIVDIETEEKLLGHKRGRYNNDETEAESDECVISKERKIIEIKVKKQRHIKISLDKNNTLYYNPDEEPLMVKKEKESYDPLAFML